MECGQNAVLALILRYGKVVMQAPHYEMIPDTLTHWSHHRGQMTMYLRLMEQKVPAIFGPLESFVGLARSQYWGVDPIPIAAASVLANPVRALLRRAWSWIPPGRVGKLLEVRSIG